MFIKRVFYLSALIIFLWGNAFGEETTTPGELTVEKIMRDPIWMGTSPSRIFWSEDSKNIYFRWNPENTDDDSLYVVSRDGGQPEKVTQEQRKELPSRWGNYNRDFTEKVYLKYGDIFILEVKSCKIRQVTNTVERESYPEFTFDGDGILFQRDNNLFRWNIKNSAIEQLTDFRKGKEKPEKNEPDTEHERWLQAKELKLIATLQKRKERRERMDEAREAEQPNRPRSIYLNGREIYHLGLSPDGQYVSFLLGTDPGDPKKTIVPFYVNESSFTEDVSSRSKVGSPQATYEFGIYDLSRDTVYYVNSNNIPGIMVYPEYLNEYTANDSNDEIEEDESIPRDVIIRGPFWSDDGNHAMVVVLSLDYKDRWIMLLDPETGTLKSLDRQHDEAWISGPGIWGHTYEGNVGWMPNSRQVWFHSEESGYSHLYTVNIVTGEKKQLTSGQYEVSRANISRNKKRWHLTTNEVHPGDQHFYHMDINGGTPTRITNMTGGNRVYLSPDEKTLAIMHSYTNRPNELYVMPNKPNAKARQITKSLSDEFLSYPWRDPEIITFTARDGAEVYARLYQPENPTQNGPAVIFVHGAGYLQNAHKRWSYYSREFMFNNLLADRGYTVLDIDYRGSAGYGRDWRTGIYRHMGGKDLDDHVDGAALLVKEYGVDSSRIGIYGGSYGGFIALMAMFTQPGIFTAGAALRPVTDWAHYEHDYTSAILNIPYNDSLAYVRSSPIYFAEGLQGALLICHGMNDTNVHFQDAVRLTQRLIELGKENWELAAYPAEGHSFREASSWTDEYKRILKLFEDNLM